MLEITYVQLGTLCGLSALAGYGLDRFKTALEIGKVVRDIETANAKLEPRAPKAAKPKRPSTIQSLNGSDTPEPYAPFGFKKNGEPRKYPQRHPPRPGRRKLKHPVLTRRRMSEGAKKAWAARKAEAARTGKPIRSDSPMARLQEGRMGAEDLRSSAPAEYR